MDPFSRLPVECLEQILRCISSLSAFQARPTLAALCRVNRHISRVTIPFLYKDPFRLADDRVYKVKAPRLSRALIRSLVIRLPTTHVHPALLLGLHIPPYFTTTNNNNSIKTSPDSMSPTSRSIDYHGLIRHLNIYPSTFLVYNSAGTPKPNYAVEKAYIHGQTFLDMYLKDRKDATCVKTSQSSLLLQYYPNVLHREATWTLAAPILDQLESLTILLSDLDRYCQVVDRLGRLEHLVVYLDVAFTCYCCMRSPNEQRRKLREEATMRQLVQLVKDHISIFPGRLKTVATYNSPFWDSAGPQSCPKEIKQKIFQMLPSSYRPDYISTFNWDKISTFLMTTDLSGVKTIHWVFGLLPPYSWFGPAVDHQNILQRCRALTQLEVYCLVRNCFDWAVQEKKDFDSRHLDTSGSSSPSSRLVALSKVTIQQFNLPLHDLDALAFAFSRTLEHLDILSFSGPGLTLPVHIGRGWPDLRHLKILKIHAPKHRLALDPLLLAQCPTLTEVKVTDETYEYSSEDIVHCLSAALPGLTKLYLKGWSALSFHPMTLKSTPELTTLKLSMHRSEHCFIPPVAELSSCRGFYAEGDGSQTASAILLAQPQWTWSWHLPRLKHLALTSEFAYRFEFKMLQGCPALEYLRLHMRTTDRHHARVITEKDLYLHERRIVAPKLRKLYMNGRWFIESPSVLLPQFLGRMFPKLERLVARG
ncbi:hypothetical protein KI688_010508 [Linnemannia hyalina]|uniref:F-box domain-containing protein n=1 Tax=Linnemannia hyalina TaxID=64524 RepID=A0A9P7XY28_9FUNG|nr:hypothetical protein KI688_010508 [Linnemannia hyalina]